jgi:hypothetical protein
VLHISVHGTRSSEKGKENQLFATTNRIPRTAPTGVRQLIYFMREGVLRKAERDCLSQKAREVRSVAHTHSALELPKEIIAGFG